MRILHLYHDVMNLYGEYGNIAVLTKVLKSCNIETEVICCGLWEKPDFSSFDFVYMGAGTEENQKLVLEKLSEEKEAFQEYVNKGGAALFTGNSFEILGDMITEETGKQWQGLKILPFRVRQQKKNRLTGDAVFSTSKLREETVGFINKCSCIEGIEIPCFQVLMGMGNEDRGKKEGITFKNLMGTHLTGPLLVKNPYLLLALVNDLIKKERKEGLTLEEKESLEKGVLAESIAAYEVTLRELKKRMEKEK